MMLSAALLPGGCKKRHGGSSYGDGGTSRGARGAPKVPQKRAVHVTGILVFSATWCPSCHRLKHEVLEGPSRKELLSGLRLRTVDFDAPQNRALVIKHAVTDLPTTVFLKTGEEVDRIEGYEEIEAFVTEARTIVQGHSGIHLLQDRLLRSPTDRALMAKLGRKLLQRGREQEAFRLYDRVLLLDPRNSAGLAAKVTMHRARYLIRVRRDYGAAVTLLGKAVAAYPSGRAAESFRYWYGWALCKAGRRAEAAKTVDAYVTQQDGSAKALLMAAELRQKCRYQLPVALTFAQRAVAKDPKDDGGWHLVATLSYELGKRKAASAAMAKALKLAPKSTFYQSEARRLRAK